MNIFILYGGTSAEHKVSISSGLSIAEAIADLYNVEMVMYSDQIFKNPQELLGCDLVFNALHGGDGENGVLQTFLDLHRIGYTGSGAKASKIAMDKNLTKLIARSININTPNWIMIQRDKHVGMQLHDNQSLKFSYPYIIKPSSEGSTFGLSIVQNESDLEEAIYKAGQFSNDILIEEFIPGRELTVGILGNKPLPIVEIVPQNSLYDYDCKYTKGMSEYIVPADISDSLQRSISEDAVKLYKTIGCRHYARIDFRLNDNNEYHMLEINTLPGMTTTSLLPKAAEAAGLSFSKLINTVIQLANIDK